MVNRGDQPRFDFIIGFLGHDGSKLEPGNDRIMAVESERVDDDEQDCDSDNIDIP